MMEEEKNTPNFQKTLGMTCSLCSMDFVYILKKEDCYEDLKLEGTGVYCPSCETKCLICSEKTKDPNNDMNICSNCYQAHEEESRIIENEADDDEEEEEVDGDSSIEDDDDDNDDSIDNESSRSDDDEEEENNKKDIQGVIEYTISVIESTSSNEEDGDKKYIQSVVGTNLEEEKKEEEEEEQHNFNNEDSNDDLIEIFDDEYTKGDSDICRKLTNVFNQSNGHLGSDGGGGPTNGELGDKGCRIISKELKLGIIFF